MLDPISVADQLIVIIGFTLWIVWRDKQRPAPEFSMDTAEAFFVAYTVPFVFFILYIYFHVGRLFKGIVSSRIWRVMIGAFSYLYGCSKKRKSKEQKLIKALRTRRWLAVLYYAFDEYFDISGFANTTSWIFLCLEICLLLFDLFVFAKISVSQLGSNLIAHLEWNVDDGSEKVGLVSSVDTKFEL